MQTFSAFGSVTLDDFNDNSDNDFVVNFYKNDPFEYTNLYFELKDKLEELLKRQIDFMEYRAIKNQYFKNECDGTKVLIYGQ